MSRDISNQIMLLRHPSNLTLNVHGVEQLPHLWATSACTTPTWNNFFIIPNLNPHSFSLKLNRTLCPIKWALIKICPHLSYKPKSNFNSALKECRSRTQTSTTTLVLKISCLVISNISCSSKEYVLATSLEQKYPFWHNGLGRSVIQGRLDSKLLLLN